MALLTLLAIWSWYPLSFIFLAYIAAFNLKVLPSYNFFDYITDGFLFVMSVGVLLFLAFQPKSAIKEEGQGERAPVF